VTTSVGEAALGLSELQLRSQFQGERMNVSGRVNAAASGRLRSAGTSDCAGWTRCWRWPPSHR
jgi:translocation and assembly module TamB